MVVAKKDGTKRICVDYRALNKKVVRDEYPLPLIDDQIEKLYNAKVFTKLDLRNGFFHVPVDQDSRKYTTFVTESGTFEFLKMPFGFCNSPAVFQRFINCIFQPLIRDGTLFAFMDDLLIPSANETEALEKLEKVLKLSSEYGLDIKWKKCEFLTTKVEYLGVVIENGTMQPSESKIKAVKKMAIPNNEKELQRFLGLTGYFRKYIHNYALIARPLSDLLRRENKFVIKQEHLEAIQILKMQLSRKPILNIFSYEKETELHCDAAKKGLGAILLQKNSEDSAMHPVYYLSKKTTPAEENLSSYELEILAIIYALNKFRLFLLGIQFKIITDCKAFSLTMNKKEISPKIARWALLLSEFSYTIEHRCSTKMQHVDALSRAPIVAISVVSQIHNAQRQDESLKTIMNLLKKQDNYENYIVNKEILYKEVNGKNVLVVPSKIQQQIIKHVHDDCHFGTKKMEEIIKRQYFIPELKKKIESCIQNCIHCILGSRKSGKQEGFLNPIPKGETPLDTLHLDHLGPMQRTKKQYNHLLVITDAFSKFVWIFPTKSTGAEEALSKLTIHEATFGSPRRFIGDKGAAFKSNIFKEYCEEKRIELILITTGVPRGNGQVERQNNIIKASLTKLSIDNPESWYKFVNRVQQAMNSTYQRSIRTTPFDILIGIPMRREIDNELNEIIDDETRELFLEDRKKQRTEAKENINKIQEENKKQYDKKRKAANLYSEGDIVAIKRTQFINGMKLHSLYLGPYKVTKVKRNDRYDVEKIGEHEGPGITSTSVDNMKPWAGGWNLGDSDLD